MAVALIFNHECGDVTITGKELKNVDLCLALSTLEQEEVFVLTQFPWMKIIHHPYQESFTQMETLYYIAATLMQTLKQTFKFYHGLLAWNNLYLITPVRQGPWFLEVSSKQPPYFVTPYDKEGDRSKRNPFLPWELLINRVGDPSLSWKGLGGGVGSASSYTYILWIVLENPILNFTIWIRTLLHHSIHLLYTYILQLYIVIIFSIGQTVHRDNLNQHI